MPQRFAHLAAANLEIQDPVHQWIYVNSFDSESKE